VADRTEETVNTMVTDEGAHDFSGVHEFSGAPPEGPWTAGEVRQWERLTQEHSRSHDERGAMTEDSGALRSPSVGPGQQLRAGVHGAGVGHRNAEPLAEFDRGADDGFEFPGPPRFQILKHPGLVLAGRGGSGHELFDGDGELESEGEADGFGFYHDVARQRGQFRVAGHLRRVARVSTLMGLNATLPRIFAEISWPMRAVTGQRSVNDFL